MQYKLIQVSFWLVMYSDILSFSLLFPLSLLLISVYLFIFFSGSKRQWKRHLPNKATEDAIEAEEDGAGGGRRADAAGSGSCGRISHMVVWWYGSFMIIRLV